MKHTYIYIVLFLLLLAGCEHDRSIFDGDLAPVRIIPSLDEAAPAGTRVVDVTWTANDPVGVSISSDATTFKEYKASAGTPVTLTPKDAANTLYYPSTGTVTFRAFCPYQAPASNVVTYNTFTDQNTSAKMQAVDLVYHSGATGSKSTAATPVSMVFQHKFSKVVITATRGAGVTDNLTNLAMTLTGMPTSAAFNVSTGALGTVSGTGTILPEHYSKAAATTSAHAIIAPHAGKTGRTITFAVGSIDYSYTIPDDFEFETGKAYTFEFTLTQTAPELSNTTIVPWNSGTIAWDGEGNSLTAPTEVTHYKDATDGNTIVIKTNHTATPGLTYNDLDWLTPGTFTQTKADSPYEWTLTYTVAANGTGADRTGNIEIAVGTMKVVTTVTQKGTSHPATPVDGNTNCFIIAPGTAITFPLSRPISQGTATSSATFTVEKLWDDATGGAVSSVSVDGTGSNATITVVAGNSPGNALVAAKVNDVIVWSYHIWVTDYNPYAATFAKNNLTFMDRNLGATTVGMPDSDITETSNTTGLYYQWGRKDPFPATGASGATQPGGGSFTAVQTTAALGTVDNTIKNPSVFYYQDSSPYDWYFEGNNHTLWGHDGAKTVYDPCPAGWRVPRYTSGTGDISDATSPWYGFTTSATWTDKRGRAFGTNAYYQASGSRSFISGALGSVGAYGYYWSASPYSSSNNHAGSLSFNSSEVSPADSYLRANGFSVRCVQDIPEPVATYVDGNTNCFIVPPGTAIKFPLSRPISEGTANTSSVFTVEKLWDDAIGGAVSNVWVEGTGSNALVTVVAGNSPGNALVAAKVGANIVWSYHIWVTDYNPYAATFTNTYNTNNNGKHFVFMDRNLGATAAGTGSGLGKGLFYQWGRKDPFPATLAPDATQPGGGSFTASPAVVDASTGTIDYAIKNPNVFLKANDTSGWDWHYGTGATAANRENNRWGHVDKVKTVYDPCPVGWKVPLNYASATSGSSATSPWNGFTTSDGGTWSNGYTWNANAAYPAAGCRGSNSAALSTVGSYGCYWSASPASAAYVYAASMYFSSGGVNVFYYSANRAAGYSVRCVQE